MKKVFLRFGLVMALGFGVLVGNAAEEKEKAAATEKANVEQVKTQDADIAAGTKTGSVESVVVKKRVMTEAELKEAMATGKLVLRQDAWYEYDGVGDLDDPNSYNRTTYTDFTIGSLCPTGTARLCAIKVLAGADNDGEHPDEDALQDMVEDIEDAIGTGSTSLIRIKPPAGN